MEELLYHYTTHDGLLGIIGGKNLWTSNIHYLNDSKEFVHAIDEAKIVISKKSSGQNNESFVELYEAIDNQLNGILRVRILVASLTELGDLLSQWRGYCSGGAGYSIGFSKTAIASLAERQGFRLAPCVYDWEQQRNEILELISKSESTVRLHGAGDKAVVQRAADQFIADFINVAPFLKHRAFSEEREWRLVSYLISSEDNRLKMRAGRSTIIPYISFDLRMNDGTLPVRSIFIGPGPNQGLAANALPEYLIRNEVHSWQVTISQTPYRTT